MQKVVSKYSFTTRLHDIDAAGFMFYARSFYHLHDAYEEMLNEHNLKISDILKGQYLFPISHAEADFKVPIKLNQFITIEVFSVKFEQDRFTLRYDFKNKQGKTVITALTRHVCIDKQSYQATEIPVEWINMLTARE